jgi:hypothetical protein
MYRAFGAVTLPARDGPPREVAITAAARPIPGIDALAMRVAPLLLTGAPVCVLGADDTGLEERLRFIDTVMGLLPYGFRARMAAATWTRPTHRNHRFRLFFSSEPRAAEKPDHVVSWGEPELAKVPGGDAGHYYGWLADKLTPLASLAQMHRELGFGDSADSEALRLVDEIRLWRRPRLKPLAPDSRDGRDGADRREGGDKREGADRHDGPRQAAVEADPVERLLRECDEHVRQLNLSRLRQDLDLLQKRLAAGGIEDARRRRYLALAGRLDLLRPQPQLGKYEARFYDTLIALCCGGPVGYEAFCLIEDCVRRTQDTPAHRTLLEAIDRAGPADMRTRLIVYASHDTRKLDKWLGSREVDAFRLISDLARGTWRRKEHGRLFCDVMLRYLREREGRYSSAEIRRVMAHNGYLARAVQAVGRDQYQVFALSNLLVAAFPEEQYPLGLDEETISEILAHTPDAPTPALLAAVLRKIPEAQAPLAWAAYVYGSVARMELDDATHGSLWTRLPPVEPEQAPVREEP